MSKVTIAKSARICLSVVMVSFALSGVLEPILLINGYYAGDVLLLIPYFLCRKDLKKYVNLKNVELKLTIFFFLILLLSAISLLIYPENQRPILSETRAISWFVFAYLISKNFYSFTLNKLEKIVIAFAAIYPILFLIRLSFQAPDLSESQLKIFPNLFLLICIVALLIELNKIRWSFLIIICWMPVAFLSLFRTSLLIPFYLLLAVFIYSLAKNAPIVLKVLLSLGAILIIFSSVSYIYPVVEQSLRIIYSGNELAYNQILAKTFDAETDSSANARLLALSEALEFRQVTPSLLGTGNTTFDTKFDAITNKNNNDSTYLYLSRRLGILAVPVIILFGVNIKNSRFSLFNTFLILPSLLFLFYITGAQFSVPSLGLAFGFYLGLLCPIRNLA